MGNSVVNIFSQTVTLFLVVFLCVCFVLKKIFVGLHCFPFMTTTFFLRKAFPTVRMFFFCFQIMVLIQHCFQRLDFVYIWTFISSIFLPKM